MLMTRAKIQATVDGRSAATSSISLSLLHCGQTLSPLIPGDCQPHADSDLGLQKRYPKTEFGDADSSTAWSSKTTIKFDELEGVSSSFQFKDSRTNSSRSLYCAVLILGDWTTGIRKQPVKAARSINGLIRRTCSRVPLGWACLSQEGGAESKRKDSCGGCGEEVVANAFEDKPKKVLILMSDTGGGHRASAEAIKAAFAMEYGDKFKVTVIDLWKEHTPWPFNQVPRTYNFLVKHEALWKLTFHGTAPRVVHQSNFAATSVFVAREVAKGLLKYQPDVIVSVHPLMQHIPLQILKTRGLLKKIPFTTVITDLNTCHPTWFHKLVTLCFCPTNEVAKRALKAGLRALQVRVHGLPVRPTFCKPAGTKAQLRNRLGMDEELPAVLLMGGGEGMGPVEATAKALGQALKDHKTGNVLGQLVVICGRNNRLAKKLKSLNWYIPVQIRGFEVNMSEWMGACDCIITKAGPGTIAEAMIRGLPILLNDYIAGQEAGNVPFVVKNGAGRYCEDPKEISIIVAEWFSSKSKELEEMAQNALKLGRPDAVFKIVHDLAELVQPKGAFQRHDLNFGTANLS